MQIRLYKNSFNSNLYNKQCAGIVCVFMWVHKYLCVYGGQRSVIQTDWPLSLRNPLSVSILGLLILICGFFFFIYMGVRDLNSGPHCYIKITLPAEPPPSLELFWNYMCRSTYAFRCLGRQILWSWSFRQQWAAWPGARNQTAKAVFTLNFSTISPVPVWNSWFPAAEILQWESWVRGFFSFPGPHNVLCLSISTDHSSVCPVLTVRELQTKYCLRCFQSPQSYGQWANNEQ